MSARHTPTPWVEIDGFIEGPDGISVIATPRRSDDEQIENAQLAAAAVNSYAKHCADPVAAAEGDLLGEMKEALSAIAEALGDATGRKGFWFARRFLDTRDIYNGDLGGDAVLQAVARSVLAKVKP